MSKLIHYFKVTLMFKDGGVAYGYHRKSDIEINNGFIIVFDEPNEMTQTAFSADLVAHYQVKPIYKED